ncbi:MAG: PglY protein, partial [Actinocrinis sp.]
ERIEPGYALRTQALPGEQEFAAALGKAASLFGTRTAPSRNNRNTSLLAKDVRDKAKRAEPEVNALRDSLRAATHSKALGLTADAPRLAAVDAAVDLIAKIMRHDADTPLVRQVAALDYPISDHVLAKTITSATEVYTALDRTQWPIVESVREMAKRDDDLGEQARSLAGRLTETANSDEFTRPLAGALREVATRGVTLLSESQRRAAVALAQANATTPPPPIAPPTTPETDTQPRPSSADQISITKSGRPQVSGTGRARQGIRRVPANQPSALETAFDALLAEARGFAGENPGVEIEFSWRVADDASAHGETGA